MLLRWLVGVPMVFMMAMTLSALVLQILEPQNMLIAVVAVVLLVLAVWITVEAVIAMVRKPRVA